MQVAYMANKLFADGSQELRIKINNEITQKQILKSLIKRRINEYKKKERNKQLIEKFNSIPFTAPNYFRERQKIEYELKLRNFDNVRRSANRARQNLYDICKCNEFDFFVTFTCDGEKVNRFDDNEVKSKFTQWANAVRKQFPKMYYVTTPEYHKNGGLHFHMLVGGISFEELKCVPATTPKGNLIFKNGKQIFNVIAWKWGYSTLSRIENSEASKHYICKYITKQNLDDRFFCKRRYYTSQNISRPIVTKWLENPEDCIKYIDTDVYLIVYCDTLKKYAVLTTDGNGEVDTARNTPQSKSGLARLAVCAERPAMRCPLLDIRDT